MIVEIDYYGATVAELPGGKIESPPNLTITLQWDDPTAGEPLCLPVGQDVEAEFDAITARLVAVDGLVTNLDAWRLVPAVIGKELWQCAESAINRKVDNVERVTVEPVTFAPLHGTWQRLAAAARSGNVVNLPGDPRMSGEIMKVLSSEPGLLQWMIETADRIIGCQSDP